MTNTEKSSDDATAMIEIVLDAAIEELETRVVPGIDTSPGLFRSRRARNLSGQ